MNLRKQNEEKVDMEVQEYNPEDWSSPKVVKSCYISVNKITKEEVVIPMCYSVVHSNDIEDCVCSNKKQLSIQDLKKENQTLKEIIQELEEEINYLKNFPLVVSGLKK